MLSHEPIKQEFIIPEGLEMNQTLIDEFQKALTASESEERIEAVKTIGYLIYTSETPITSDSILQLLEANDLSRCPIELLNLFHQIIKLLPEAKLELLVIKLKEALPNLAAMYTLMALHALEKDSLTTDELKVCYEHLSKLSNATDNSNNNRSKALAMFLLWYMYSCGLYVEKNTEQELIYLQQASDLDLPIAIYHLALSYENGHMSKELSDEERNEKKVVLLERASALDLPIALVKLAWMYEHGHLGDQPQTDRDKRAEKLYKKASALGEPVAMSYLAVMYEQCRAGEGSQTERDKRAEELYEKTSALKLPSAMLNLAVMYKQNRAGLSLEPRARSQKAIDLLKKALSLGDGRVKKQAWLLLNRLQNSYRSSVSSVSRSSRQLFTPTSRESRTTPISVAAPPRSRVRTITVATDARVREPLSNPSDSVGSVSASRTAETRTTSSVSMATLIAQIGTLSQKMDLQFNAMHQELGTMANDITQLKRGMAEIKHRIDSFDNTQQENSKRLRVRR